jgi:prepilin-type processing-associated H-X9-DG protein
MGQGTAGPTGNSIAATAGWRAKATLTAETGTNSATITAAWMDNSQHGKNANVGLADGSVHALSIAKLREGLKNTADVNNNRLLFP